MNYSIGQYRDCGGAYRDRWAVFCALSRCWHFPKRYGKRAAVALCNRLNRADSYWFNHGIVIEVKP